MLTQQDTEAIPKDRERAWGEILNFSKILLNLQCTFLILSRVPQKAADTEKILVGLPKKLVKGSNITP